ncbi:MAG TPA: polyprenol monophosphomannose synthase [Pirellulales bacterium]
MTPPTDSATGDARPAPGDAAASSGPRVLVFVATYNERENLPRLVEEILAHLPAADVLVIDDNSPDGTGTWCDERAAGEPRLRCLHRSGKLGLGTAVLAGLHAAIDGGYDYAINLDADFSHSPAELPKLQAGMNFPDGSPRVDVMIGSRYAPGGAIEGWPLKRKVLSRGVNWLSRWWLWLSPRDCSGAYRCYRVSTLKRLDWKIPFRSTGYSFLEELLWRLARVGATFGESPITFVERIAGASKVNAKEAATSLGVLLRLGLDTWLRPRSR